MNVIKRPGGHRSRRYIFRKQNSLPVMELITEWPSWDQVAYRPADAERGTPLQATWEILPGLTVTYIEEDTIRSSFAMVTSRLGPETAGMAVAVFEVHPEVVTVDELIAELDSARGTDDEAVAVARAGLGAPLEPDERLVQRISSSLRSADDVVREGALWAVSYSEWPIFRKAVRQLAESDPNTFIKEFAAGVLDAFDRFGLEDS
ncbi:hypothetical protein [Kitasatospora sp. NPDC001225]